VAQSSSQTITTNKPTPSYFTGWMPFLSPNQQCQSTEGKGDLNAMNQYKLTVKPLVQASKEMTTVQYACTYTYPDYTNARVSSFLAVTSTL